MKHFGIFWDVSGCLKHFGGILGCSGTVWDLKGHFRTLWDFLGLLGMCWAFWEVIGCIRTYLDIFGCFGMFGRLWDNCGCLGMFFAMAFACKAKPRP